VASGQGGRHVAVAAHDRIIWYRRRVAQSQRCPRCGTAVPAGKVVCQHCEQPIYRGSASVRYNPAGLAPPSPIQGHATVLVAVVGALVVLAALAFNALGGVGPFAARVTGTEVRSDRSGMTVQLQVTNNGSRAGKANCRVTGRDGDGGLHDSQVLLSDRVEPGRSVRLSLPLDGVRRADGLDATCS
jgi:hypothetical protein